MPRLFVEHLSVIDCAYLDAERGLVGASWIVDLELGGALDAQSMVLDFGEVKRRLKRAIDDSLDHSLLVPARDPALRQQPDGDGLSLHYRSAIGDIYHRSPACAVSLLETAQVNPAAVITALRQRLAAVLPPSVDDIGLQLREESIGGARYRYAHGLKKHDGHCQRIAHGHRSRIQISVDGVRDAALEQDCAQRWHDVYLGSREDLLAPPDTVCRFGYSAPEGRFELTLPTARCDLLDGDTTVECIAEHLARRYAAQRPGQRLQVRAYEGVMKGALAERAD